MIEKYHLPVSSEPEVFTYPGEDLKSFFIMPAEKYLSIDIELKKIRKCYRRILFISDIIQLPGLYMCFTAVRAFRMIR